jgi:hypothetical protein
MNLLLTQLTTENLKNLLFSEFELSLSFDNELIIMIIFAINFNLKTCELFMINEYNKNS